MSVTLAVASMQAVWVRRRQQQLAAGRSSTACPASSHESTYTVTNGQVQQDSSWGGRAAAGRQHLRFLPQQLLLLATLSALVSAAYMTSCLKLGQLSAVCVLLLLFDVHRLTVPRCSATPSSRSGKRRLASGRCHCQRCVPSQQHGKAVRILAVLPRFRFLEAHRRGSRALVSLCQHTAWNQQQC